MNHDDVIVNYEFVEKRYRDPRDYFKNGVKPREAKK